MINDGLDSLPRYPCPIIVTGNKFYDTEAVAWEVSKIIDKYLCRGYKRADICVVTSGTKGVEEAAHEVAKKFKINSIVIDQDIVANNRLKKLRQPITDARMIEYCRLCLNDNIPGEIIIMWRGESQRLKDFLNLAKEKRFHAINVPFPI